MNATTKPSGSAKQSSGKQGGPDKQGSGKPGSAKQDGAARQGSAKPDVVQQDVAQQNGTGKAASQAAASPKGSSPQKGAGGAKGQPVNKPVSKETAPVKATTPGARQADGPAPAGSTTPQAKPAGKDLPASKPAPEANQDRPGKGSLPAAVFPAPVAPASLTPGSPGPGSSGLGSLASGQPSPAAAEDGLTGKAKSAARGAWTSVKGFAEKLAGSDSDDPKVVRRSAKEAAAAGVPGAAAAPAAPATAVPTIPAAGAPQRHPVLHPATAPRVPVAAQPAGWGQQSMLPQGPRRARLAVSRIDPWSVMKLGFLLAVAIGVMTVVATMVFWLVVDRAGLFATAQNFINDVVGQQSDVDLAEVFAFDRVVSLATLVAVINVALITAIVTIIAIIYNLTAALVGGVHVTLTDD
ncbi:MAG: DUF3566 domain-containing protein [Promicromonosporaceae bacterium]|nr:DUF3566 domain-containing protein [Promicromonosporaceae bacterium]